MIGTPLRQKIGLILFGLFLCAALLEISLRLAGLAALSLQENKNRVPLGKKKGYRIMCLGESTTAWGNGESWPSQLEEVLNEKNTGIRFKMINKGRPSVDTSGILSKLEENLNKYNPDMVITMMGVNDWVGTLPYEDTPAVKTKLFIGGFRVYKLARLLWLRIVNKVNELKFYKGIRVEKANPNKKEKYPQAEGMFKKAIELNPQDDVSYADLGHLYNNQNRYKEAETMFKKAIELNPNNSSAYDGLRSCYTNRGRYPEAEEMFKKAIELNPQIDWVYTKLGYFYNNQGRYEEAKAMFKKAIELNPNSAGAYVGLGRCYREEGRSEDVMGIAQKAIEADPTDKDGYVLLGNSYLYQRRYPEAETAFKNALEIDPAFEPTYTELGRCYRAQGKLKEIKELAQKILKEKIQNDRLYGFIATSYKEQGKQCKAEEYSRLADQFRLRYYNPATRHNYQKLKEAVTQRGIKLVCLQYPLRSIEPLKKLFDSTEGIIFVENKKIFEDALRHGKYEDYFVDNFGGEFGHGTPRGNRLLAENIANVILKEVFKR